MKELFRLRIAAKRQMTVPQRLMNIFDLEAGDELQLTVENKVITTVVPYKCVPAHLVTPEVSAAIEESRREFREHKTGDVDDLDKRLQKSRQGRPA